MNQTAIYLTPGISTGHCRAAIIEELGRLNGINSVGVDLEAMVVRVTADQIEDTAVIAAIYEAGYEAIRDESLNRNSSATTSR